MSDKISIKRIEYRMVNLPAGNTKVFVSPDERVSCVMPADSKIINVHMDTRAGHKYELTDKCWEIHHPEILLTQHYEGGVFAFSRGGPEDLEEAILTPLHMPNVFGTGGVCWNTRSRRVRRPLDLQFAWNEFWKFSDFYYWYQPPNDEFYEHKVTAYKVNKSGTRTLHTRPTTWYPGFRSTPTIAKKLTLFGRGLTNHHSFGNCEFVFFSKSIELRKLVGSERHTLVGFGWRDNHMLFIQTSEDKLLVIDTKKQVAEVLPAEKLTNFTGTVVDLPTK